MSEDSSSELRRSYDAMRSDLAMVAINVRDLLEASLKLSQIPLHSVTRRVKEFDSLVAKSRGANLKRPLKQMTDLIGIRVVVLFESDLERVDKVIRELFRIVKSDYKIDGLKASDFAYFDTHYIARFRHESDSASLPVRLFEIQVRTAVNDAWAAISHHTQYKREGDIPGELTRDLHALKALFYLADRHIQYFEDSRQNYKSQVAAIIARSGPLNDIPLNIDTLRCFIESDSRMDDRPQPNPQEWSMLLRDLRAADINDIGELKRSLESGWTEFQDKEVDFLRRMSNRPEATTPVRGKVSILNAVEWAVRAGNQGYDKLLKRSRSGDPEVIISKIDRD